MRTQPIANLIQRMRKTNDEEERKAICDFVKNECKATLPKKLEDIPQEVKDVVGVLEKTLGACVEIHRIEVPERKRRFRKKPRKEGGNETRRVSRRERSICESTGIHSVASNESSKRPAGDYNYQMAVIPGEIGESKRNRNNTFVNADV